MIFHRILHLVPCAIYWTSQMAQGLKKKPPANAGDAGDVGSMSGSKRSSGEGNRSPFQYSCLGNSMDRGAWQPIVHRVAKSCTGLSTRAR